MNKKGFTLIELLVVISIISLLASVILVTANNTRMKSRDIKRKTDLQQISKAIVLYSESNNGNYPPVWFCNYGPGCYMYSTDTVHWFPSLLPYMAKVPSDPINNNFQPWTDGNYSYAYGNVINGKSFELLTQLENPSDPDRCGVQNYTYFGTPWCTAFGGAYSNQLYIIKVQ